MKKASNILLLIGEILEIVYAFLFLLLGVLFLVLTMPNFTQILIEGINNGSVHSSFQGTPEEIARAIQAMFAAFSVIMFVFAAFNAIGAIITIFARRKLSSGILVTAAVFSFIGGSIVAGVGAIFALVNNENKPAIKAEEPNEFE
ncbi:MAG: hypothetical protein II467_07025 [Bacilli bacterium]|nr:hypothetical protein [Bacilli bacterium]